MDLGQQWDDRGRPYCVAEALSTGQRCRNVARHWTGFCGIHNRIYVDTDQPIELHPSIPSFPAVDIIEWDAELEAAEPGTEDQAA